MFRTQVASPVFEPLEQRVALDATPFPTLEMLEDPSNAVVRLETRYGTIDLELFGGDAPIASAGFIDLTDDGGYGSTFFHRLVAGASLAGGLFRFSDEEGLSLRESTFNVDGEFLRPNVEQTIAVHVVDGATTGEWVFNLADNSGGGPGEWLVIGRVVQGWETVQTIAALPIEDLSGFFTGTPGEGLTEVPVTGNDPPPTEVTEDLLVLLRDAQVIKEFGTTDFYTNVLYYPEGFSWERVFEAVELLNPGESAADYKVLVRYEWGSRDATLAKGTLEADRRETIIVSPGEVLSTLVRGHTPYAFEIWSTGPIAAGIRHMDFRSGVGEAFFNPASAPDPELLRSWSFNQAALGYGESEAFILWQNITGEDTTVTLTLYFQNADPIVETFTLEAHRRGGVRIRDLELPPGEEFVGALVTADTEIVASITRFDRRPGDDDEGGPRQGGIAALGTPGGGTTEGVAPWTHRGRNDTLSILNTGTETATVTFFVLEEEDEDEEEGHGHPTPVQVQVTVAPGRLLILSEDDILGSEEGPARFAFWSIDGPWQHGGRAFSLRYTSDVPVTVSFQTSAFRGTGTAFGYFGAEETHFADARVFTAPRGAPFGKQALAVYNPGDTDVTLHFVFRFSGHEPVVTQTLTLGAGESLVQRVNRFAPLLAQFLHGLGSLKHNAYSVSVIASAPVVAQTIQRNDDGRSELGMTLAPWVLLSSIP